MRVAGIISEFNPFHKGHRYLIDTVRKDLQPDGIIAVMSGNFVQRGEPAMWDKWIRAACAVENGVDLVLELPVCYAVNSGEEFARGGIGVLKGTGIVTDLAFGSESGSRALLEGTADLLAEESESFSAAMRTAMSHGISYPAAYERAASSHPELRSEKHRGLLRASNDILALEYMKQIRRSKAAFEIFPVQRIGPGHDQEGSSQGFASAGSIRRAILEGSPWETWRGFLPADSSAVLACEEPFGTADSDRYAALLRYTLQTHSKDELGRLISVTEGLENRLKQAAIRGVTVQDIVMGVKTKRYTYARIARIMVQALLGMDKDRYRQICEDQAFYGRVLGFSRRGAALLRQMRRETAGMPVYTNPKQWMAAGGSIRDSLAWDALASDIYSIIKGTTVYQGSEYVRKPYVSNKETEIICTSAHRGV